ncbi:copper amine oxidase N-terminal domain-containing protein [Paenibacillus caui]|uniref:copper amine oxidase N-terminal domain-containing protein n=1 Tax=Paenibacillus caui TaxID=2873927 RepID=UPI001CA9663D|nr:copper amine oxidase N-terminal domain-containing protein [Paenibacillus caui]
MKKFGILLWVVVLWFSAFTGVDMAAVAADQGQVPGNDQTDTVKTLAELPIVELKEKGVVLKNNTMLPAAALFKELGAQIQYNSKTDDIKLGLGHTTVAAKVNSKYVWINGAKTFYNVPPQMIEDKLMLPLQVIKDAFKVTVTVAHGTLDDQSKFLRSVTLTSETKKIYIQVNSAYETYQKYLGKTAWIHNTSVYITELDGTLSSSVKNMAQVKITKIERDELIGDWLTVYFTHKNKSYKVRHLHQSNFPFTFYMTSPYKTYNFPQKYWQQIENNQISVGMTSNMVYLAWGPYSRHYLDNYSSGSTDTWVYEITSTLSEYLLFKDGVLQSFSRH